MQKTAFKAVLFFGALVFLSPVPAHATSTNEPTSTDKPLYLNTFEQTAQATNTNQKSESDKVPEEKPAAEPAKEVPVQHTVAEGESLTIIAEKHASTWMRLFSKNTQVANPDILHVGEIITIPLASEQLPERPLPAIPPPVFAMPAAPAAPSQNNQNYTPAYQPQGNSAGNTYYAGYCTWYAKNRRPDLPNNLGNANEWVYRAQAQGIATGSTPRVGAIGQQGMHVVYVESVNGDGTVTISEMNYQGLYVTSSRTVPAGSFTYIY